MTARPASSLSQAVIVYIRPAITTPSPLMMCACFVAKASFSRCYGVVGDTGIEPVTSSV
jgi:hypothetical protein